MVLKSTLVVFLTYAKTVKVVSAVPFMASNLTLTCCVCIILDYLNPRTVNSIGTPEKLRGLFILSDKHEWTENDLQKTKVLTIFINKKNFQSTT